MLALLPELYAGHVLPRLDDVDRAHVRLTCRALCVLDAGHPLPSSAIVRDCMERMDARARHVSLRLGAWPRLLRFLSGSPPPRTLVFHAALCEFALEYEGGDRIELPFHAAPRENRMGRRLAVTSCIPVEC